MKKLLYALMLLLCAVSCQKEDNTAIAVEKTSILSERCEFGLQPSEFNMVKRPMLDQDWKKKAPVVPVVPPVVPPIVPPVTPPQFSSVIYLDFDGQTVANTSWNRNGPLDCVPSGLTQIERQQVTDSVKKDYIIFNVTVTADENVFNLANPNRRMRVIITDSWEWYGMVGGTAYINSFSWGDKTPCFVFSSLLGYSPKHIQEAVSHEAGHTLGLLHQAQMAADCTVTSEYSFGNAYLAPIMGVAYYAQHGEFIVGKTKYCTTQDDKAIITHSLLN